MAPTIPRREFGGLLWQLAELIRADETRRSFRSKAYRRAVWSVDYLPADLEGPFDDFTRVPGIGPGTARLIREFMETGHLEELEDLAAIYPMDATAISRLPRMTPTILRKLKSELGIDTVSEFLSAIDSDAILSIKGVGPASVDLWDETLRLVPEPNSFPSHQAWVQANTLALHLETHLGTNPRVSGLVRRGVEWVDRIDIVMGDSGSSKSRAFLDTTAAAAESQWMDNGAVRLHTHTGLPVWIHIAAPTEAGSRLLSTTGPPHHVARILGANPAAIPTEEEAYRIAGTQWVPPGARNLPLERSEGVIRIEDIEGDLHIHSDRSPDGRMSLLILLEAAEHRGYRYVLITDHTIGLRFGGLDGEALRAQAADIELLRHQFQRLRIFHGAELNIDRDGNLDIDDDTLDLLDVAVAAVHSHFRLDEQGQTERIIAAIRHPKVGVLAHPFGRRIGIRPGLRFDFESVVEVAAASDVALEVNGHRDRLDLSAEHARIAVESGAFVVANSDAHRVTEMGNVANAVSTMQAGGVVASQVLNALAVDEFSAWVERHS